MVAISPPGDPDDLRRVLDDDSEELPWHLREQRAYLAAQARTRNPHHHG
jgi:hypothetical protein